MTLAGVIRAAIRRTPASEPLLGVSREDVQGMVIPKVLLVPAGDPLLVGRDADMTYLWHGLARKYLLCPTRSRWR